MHIMSSIMLYLASLQVVYTTNSFIELYLPRSVACIFGAYMIAIQKDLVPDSRHLAFSYMGVQQLTDHMTRIFNMVI